MSTHSRISNVHGIIPPRSHLYKGFFGRIFSDLEPWAPPFSPKSDDTAANTFFLETANTFMKEPADADESLDSSLPAGYTYLGQFIDHDISFDPSSSLMRQNDPQMLNNFRIPRLDLDNVYASGPDASPHLYERDSHDQPIGRFLLGHGNNSNEPDLPRNQANTALIGDPRNDENLMISQIQLAFLKLHNRLFDHVFDSQDDKQLAFSEARRQVTWLYQFIVWNDFVKRIINPDTWTAALQLEVKGSTKRWKLNTEFYDWKHTPFIPVEFSVAAYRFGHSLVRNAYQINTTIGFGTEVPLFERGGNDLRGGQRLRTNHSIQWDWFLDLPSTSGPFPQMTRKIDPLLSQALSNIPAGPGGNVLAFRNLKRGWRMGLPSGTDVARHLGVSPIATEPHEEALWFYILKEAEEAGGNHLGRVGSTIVGEVFAGLLYGDPNSYLNLWPTWTPASEPFFFDKGPYAPERGWQFGDLIRMAQMPENATQTSDLLTSGSFEPSV